jgi:hypothetical protein
LSDYFALTYVLDAFLGGTYRGAGQQLGRDESVIRHRVVRRLEVIEAKLGKYIKTYNGLAHPPHSAERAGYTISESWEKRTSRLVTPRELAIPKPLPLNDFTSMRRRIARAERKVLSWVQNHFLNQAEALGYTTIKKTAPLGLARNYPTPRHKTPYAESLVRFAPSEKVYPHPPYGNEPLHILYPQPAHTFDKDEPSANMRVNGVKGHAAEQMQVIAAEPAGPAWIGSDRKPRGDGFDCEDDLLDGAGKLLFGDDPRESQDDDVVDDEHDGLTVKDVEEDDAADEDAGVAP